MEKLIGQQVDMMRCLVLCQDVDLQVSYSSAECCSIQPRRRIYILHLQVWRKLLTEFLGMPCAVNSEESRRRRVVGQICTVSVQERAKLIQSRCLCKKLSSGLGKVTSGFSIKSSGTYHSAGNIIQRSKIKMSRRFFVC